MRFLPAAALAVIAAVLVVVLVPTGAAAHAGHAHMTPERVSVAAVKDAAATQGIRAEVKAQTLIPCNASFDRTCADHGCCGSGHCSACGNAIAPSCSIDLALSIGAALPSHNAAVPSALADEGPPRPPKTLA